MEGIDNVLWTLEASGKRFVRSLGIEGKAFDRYGQGTAVLIAFGLGICICFSAGQFFRSIGIQWAHFSLPWDIWFYVLMILFFHFSEYVLTAKFNPSTLSADSFLLNHSHEYTLATIACLVEYTIELWLWKGQYEHRILWAIRVCGAAIAVGGEAIRKIAMWTAGSNFTHMVQERKRPNHVLVTSGIYRFSRHPSYFGWFWWTFGLQLLLLNPFCLAAFSLVSWHFFSDRIRVEEVKLCSFFPEYEAYRQATPVRIPFIH